MLGQLYLSMLFFEGDISHLYSMDNMVVVRPLPHHSEPFQEQWTEMAKLQACTTGDHVKEIHISYAQV